MITRRALLGLAACWAANPQDLVPLPPRDQWSPFTPTPPAAGPLERRPLTHQLGSQASEWKPYEPFLIATGKLSALQAFDAKSPWPPSAWAALHSQAFDDHVHGTNYPGYFLAWHRALLYFYELHLRAVHPEANNLTLPLWYPISGNGVSGLNFLFPDLYSRQTTPVAGILSNPLYRGDRHPDIAGMKLKAKGCETSYFLSERDGPSAVNGGLHAWHDSLHQLGDQLVHVAQSPYDPLFFSIHTHIDHFWWTRQKDVTLGDVRADAQDRTAYFPLPGTGWVKVKLIDFFDHNNLGYFYAADAKPFVPAQSCLPQELLMITHAGLSEAGRGIFNVTLVNGTKEFKLNRQFLPMINAHHGDSNHMLAHLKKKQIAEIQKITATPWQLKLTGAQAANKNKRLTVNVDSIVLPGK